MKGVQGGEHGAGLAFFKVCEARWFLPQQTDARAGENGCDGGGHKAPG